MLKIVIVGHVDHGKSTLIGRLLHDTGRLPEGKLEQLQQAAERRGVPFEWANLTDALQAERDQNVTIDTSQIWFATPKRPYVIIDAPGHREFLKNIITGAAQADAALLVIDAAEGVQDQSRRHAYLLQLLGIDQVTVVINKMDLHDYSEQRFLQVKQEFTAFLKRLGVRPGAFVPVSARHGDNVAQSSANFAWWKGPTVVEALDALESPLAQNQRPLRFPVQAVYRFDERRILAGRVESGTVKVGDRLLFSPGEKISQVKSIERWAADPRDDAEAGESIGLTLVEPVFVERGAIASLESSPPLVLNCFKARVFWMGREPMVAGRTYKLKLTTQEVECEIESIGRVTDASTLATLREGAPGSLGRHEVAELRLRTRRPLAFDVELLATSRFVIVDGLEVAGGGTLVEDSYPRRKGGSHKSGNIYWSQSKIKSSQRSARNRHHGCVVWLTGLSGSGKSTLALELEKQLFETGRQAYVLDGDNVRHGLCSDLGFSPVDRQENIRRVGEVAALFADAGVICITAFISPYRADRDRARKICHKAHVPFLEVYVDAPLAVCEKRDTKGLYARARANQIAEFTGISAPYEEPLEGEIVVDTDTLTVPESVALIMTHLQVVVLN